MRRIGLSARDKVKTDQSERRSDSLIVRRIQIEDFENTVRYESSFDSQLVVLSPENAEVIKKALGVVLKSRSLVGEKVKAAERTIIKVEIEISGKKYFITASGLKNKQGFAYSVKTEDAELREDFYRMIHQSSEEEHLSCFSFSSSDRFSDRFRNYKDAEKYYSKTDFSKQTDGIGNTRAFRSCLNNHIKEWNNRNSGATGSNQIRIKENGETVIISSAGRCSRDVLSESDSVLFEYLCYLSINQFWQKVEEIRDFNHINWPLVVFDLCERTDETVELSDYIEKALALNRQVFICKSSTERNEKKCSCPDLKD